MKTLILMVIAVLASGCASTSDYSQYVTAQQDANRQALEGQKPLVRLTAQPGQAITGLASLEVYAPIQAPVIQQSRPNEWAAVVSQGLGVLGTVGGIVAAGNAASDLATSVGMASTAGYPYIQTPQANVTTSNVKTTSVTDSGNTATQSTTGSYNPVNTTTSTTTLPPVEVAP